jgi:hypothetical protein
MGYIVKLQKVERPTNRSFYINLPAALADAVELSKGEELEWFIEEKTLSYCVAENLLSLSS